MVNVFDPEDTKKTIPEDTIKIGMIIYPKTINEYL